MIVIIDVVADVQLFHQKFVHQNKACVAAVSTLSQRGVEGVWVHCHSSLDNTSSACSIEYTPFRHVLAFPPSGLILCSPLSILYVLQTHQGISLLTSSQNDLFGSRITAYL